MPSSPETRHLFSSAAFQHIKYGVVLINAARGDLIDTRSLIQALRSGWAAAAGFDVQPDQPVVREEAGLICSIFCELHVFRQLAANHMLLRIRNAIITPHTVFNAREGVRWIVKTTVGNILGSTAGGPHNVVVDPQLAEGRH